MRKLRIILWTKILILQWILAGCASQHDIVMEKFTGWIPRAANVKVLHFDPDYSFYIIEYSDTRDRQSKIAEFEEKLKYGYSLDIQTSDTVSGEKRSSKETELIYYGAGRPGKVIFAYASIDSAHEDSVIRSFFNKDWHTLNR